MKRGYVMLKYIKEHYLPLITFSLIAGVLWFAYGCEPKTRSLLQPNRKVSGPELTIELEALVSMYEIRVDDLEKQAAFQQWFFNQTAEFATTGTANPIGVLMSLLSVFGLGAGADNLRVRKKLKDANNTSKPENENS